MTKNPKDTPTPLSQARGLLNQALGGTTNPAAAYQPPVAISSGSSSLDALISSDQRVCDGYPGGKISHLYTTQDRYEALLTAVAYCPKGPVTLITKRTDLPGATVVPDHEHAIAKMWTHVTEQKEGLIVLDDVQFGIPKGDVVSAIWSAFLPTLKARLSKNRNVALVGLSYVYPHPNNLRAYTIGGGKAWRYYTHISALFTPLPIRPESFLVTLRKNKVSISQGLSTIVSLNGKRFDEGATKFVLGHVGEVSTMSPPELLHAVASIRELEATPYEDPSFLLQGAEFQPSDPPDADLGFPQDP